MQKPTHPKRKITQETEQKSQVDLKKHKWSTNDAIPTTWEPERTQTIKGKKEKQISHLKKDAKHNSFHPSSWKQKKKKKSLEP